MAFLVSRLVLPKMPKLLVHKKCPRTFGSPRNHPPLWKIPKFKLHFFYRFSQLVNLHFPKPEPSTSYKFKTLLSPRRTMLGVWLCLRAKPRQPNSSFLAQASSRSSQLGTLCGDHTFKLISFAPYFSLNPPFINIWGFFFKDFNPYDEVGSNWLDDIPL